HALEEAIPSPPRTDVFPTWGQATVRVAEGEFVAAALQPSDPAVAPPARRWMRVFLAVLVLTFGVVGWSTSWFRNPGQAAAKVEPVPEHCTPLSEETGKDYDGRVYYRQLQYERPDKKFSAVFLLVPKGRKGDPETFY